MISCCSYCRCSCCCSWANAGNKGCIRFISNICWFVRLILIAWFISTIESAYLKKKEWNKNHCTDFGRHFDNRNWSLLRQIHIYSQVFLHPLDENLSINHRSGKSMIFSVVWSTMIFINVIKILFFLSPFVWYFPNWNIGFLFSCLSPGFDQSIEI